uniref:Uncharacterized protein n=1 Tax=Panagrolaimus davidi TaxID=227884 RepID=A0A914QQW1_9BILA
MIIISTKNNIPSSPTLSNSVQGSTSSTNNSNSNDLTSDVYYSSHLTNNEDDEKSEEVSRKLRPRDFNYYSKYTPDQSKATTHQSEPEKEEDDEEESDEKFPRIRPRGFEHYLRRYTSSSQPKSTYKQNREESDDLLLDSNEENIPSSVAKHSEAKHKLLVSARYNHFSTLQAPSSLGHVQPTSSNISQPSLSTPKSARRSMLDDDVSDDDFPPESKRQKKASFVEDVVDNERPRETVTLATAIQPHFTIDIENKADMQGPNPSKCRIAFPNQRGPCYKPPVSF